MRRLKLFLLNGLMLTATSFVLRLVGMFFSIYISKKVGTEAIGIFGLIMSVYMFFITIATSRYKPCYYSYCYCSNYILP